MGIPAWSESSSLLAAGPHHRGSYPYGPGVAGLGAGGGCYGGKRKLDCLHSAPFYCRALLWAQGRSCRRPQFLVVACSSLSSDDQGDDNFWEQPEGKKKLGEIEDMRELISEAGKLKDSLSPAPQDSQQQMGTSASGDGSGEPDQGQKLSEELAKRAKEQAEKRRQAEQMLQMGQRAYGRGMYDKAVALLEAALTNIPGSSYLGGEVQVWLAMAYEADGKHSQCIALYKTLENTHPIVSIRRQAKDLRYILEAPRLKISKEEMVSIPLIGDNYSETRTWSKMYKERRKKWTKKPTPTKDYMEEWLVWKRPRWERSPYFWVAVTVWLTLVGIALVFQD